MRIRLGLVACAFIAAVLGTFSANADPSCVNYLVVAPVVGTRQNTICVPLPSQFDFPVSFSNCRWIPPLGVTLCVGADLNLPL
jgi:hypothetical protein